MGRALLSATKACQHCRQPFAKDPRNTWAYWEKAKYCGYACTGAASKKRADDKREPIATIFWRHVSKSDGCWTWTWLKDKDGYGLLPYSKVMHRAHVVSLLLDGRPVGKGSFGCHHCDNPACVRPDHLYVGTPRDNVDDKISRGRQPLGSQTHVAKLCEEDIPAIRAMPGTHAEIAARFGVARATVSLIKERRTWRHVP